MSTYYNTNVLAGVALPINTVLGLGTLLSQVVDEEDTAFLSHQCTNITASNDSSVSSKWLVWRNDLINGEYQRHQSCGYKLMPII